MSRSTLASAASAICGLLRNGDLLLALEFLQVGLEIGAARDLHDLEQREQRDVMVVRLGARDEVARALEQVLEAQERADALVERVLVRDHLPANCRYF